MSLSLDLPQEVCTCQALTTLVLQSAAGLQHTVFFPLRFAGEAVVLSTLCLVWPGTRVQIDLEVVLRDAGA